MTAEPQQPTTQRQRVRRRPYRRPDPDRIQATSPASQTGMTLKYQTPPQPDPATVDHIIDGWRASGWTG